MTVSRFTAPPVPSILVMIADPSGVDLGDREGKIPRLGDVLETGVGEIAARHLRAALHQVADAAALADEGGVEWIPAELVHHRRQEERRIGDAAR